MLFRHIRNDPEYKRTLSIVLASCALLGEVSPNMRHIYLRPSEDCLYLRYFIDGETTEDVLQSVLTVEQRLKAFLGVDNIKSMIIRNDFPGYIASDLTTDIILFKNNEII